MNEIELGFASAAIRNERLGQGPETDLLTLSLSVNDYIGHEFGPYSEEVADTTLRTDRDLAAFFDDLDKLVGLDNVWIAFSADHGVAPSPAYIQQHKLGMGMAQPAAIRSAAEEALTQAFGPGPWIEDEDETYLFLNRDTVKKRNYPGSKSRGSGRSGSSLAGGCGGGIHPHAVSHGRPAQLSARPKGRQQL